MNTLAQILLNKKRMSEPVLRMGISKKAARITPTLLARIENLLFSDLKAFSGIDTLSITEAKTLLSRLHVGERVGDSVSISEALEKLDDIADESTFGLKLETFYEKLENVDNLESILNEFEIEETKKLKLGSVDEIPPLLPDGFFDIPSDFLLSSHDYNAVEAYFMETKRYSELSGTQKEMLESLRLDEKELLVKYTSTRELNRIHELRTQLREELLATKTMSTTELSAIPTLDRAFNSK